MISHKRAWLICGMVAFGLGTISCSKKKSTGDDDDDSSTGSVSSTGAAGKGGTTVSVSTMAALPNVEDMVKTSTGAALNLAVNGEPLKFADITADNVEEYLTGSVTTLLTEIAAAKASHTWDTVKAVGTTFRQGEEKCHIMQDAGRQLSALSQNTNDACMMAQIDKPGAGILKYASGEEVADGGFFAAADVDKVRVITMGKEGRKIVAQVQGKNTEAGIYQVALTFCQADGTSDNGTKIRIDNNARKMTLSIAHNGTRTDGTATQTHVGSGDVTGYLKLAADGTTYVFDETQPRTVNIIDKGAEGSTTHAFNASLEISGDILTSKFIGQNTFTDLEGKLSSGTNRGGTSLRFAGTKASDVVIYEGAGSHKGSFTRGTEAAFEHSDVVGFEYDETQAPKYVTVDTSTYLDTVNAFDFDTDPILSLTAPAAPDASLNDATNCALTADSTYFINGQAPALVDAKAACEPHFDRADGTCNELQNQEHAIWDAIKAVPAGQ